MTHALLIIVIVILSGAALWKLAELIADAFGERG